MRNFTTYGQSRQLYSISVNETYLESAKYRQKMKEKIKKAFRSFYPRKINSTCSFIDLWKSDANSVTNGYKM